jgi:hypothetical protein
MVKIIIIMTIFRFVLQLMRVNEPKPNLIFTIHMGLISIFTNSLVETSPFKRIYVHILKSNISYTYFLVILMKIPFRN